MSAPDLKQYGDLIIGKYSQSKDVLVFPSEIAAESWRRRISEVTGLCLSDRLISWDTFKEQRFFGQEVRRPVNSLARYLFLTELLERNATEAFFQVLVHPRYRNEYQNFKPAISSALPFLPGLCGERSPGLSESLSPALSSDFQLLYREYKKFLDRYERYEPSWVEIQYVDSNETFCIILPELLEDIDQYMAEMKASVSISWITRDMLYPSVTTPHLSEFGDYRHEFISVLRDAAESLRAGVHPEDIAISLSDYDSMMPRLSYYAKSCGLDLSPRKGKALLTYPSVSWLKAIADMYQSSFSFDSVRRVLAHPGLPWKDSGLPKAMLRRSIERNFLEGGQRRWLRLISGLTGAEKLFQEIDAIYRAGSVEELYSKVYAFIGSRLSTEQWNEVDESAWQRSADSIRELRTHLREFPEISVHPFSLVTDVLSSNLYLPQQKSTGIPVYDFRVAAGIWCRRHYCVNFSAESTSIQAHGPNMLREDQLQMLLGGSGGLSEHFLLSYLFSGDSVNLSFSRNVRGSAVLPCSLFMTGDAEVHFPQVEDSWKAAEIRGSQQSGAAALPWRKQVLRLDVSDWSPAPEPELLSKLRIPTESFSVTSLNSFLDCPFSRLWASFDQLESRPVADAYAQIGTAFHALMEALFRHIAEQDGLFRSENIEGYKQYCDLLVKQAFGIKRYDFFPDVAGIVQQQLKPRFHSAMLAILEQECLYSDGCSIETEKSVSADIELSNGSRVQLKARLDLALQGSEGTAIIDYKTGDPPKMNAILGDSKEQLPTKAESRKMGSEDMEQVIDAVRPGKSALQLPGYSLLMRENMRFVHRMGYYSAKRSSDVFPGKYSEVLSLSEEDGSLNKGMNVISSESFLRKLEENVVVQLESIVEDILAGRFPVDEAGCARCSIKAICRQNFAVRAGGDQ